MLHERIENDEIFCQRYLDERLYITLSKNHPLADRESITFAELSDTRVLVSGSVGFWMNICKDNMPEDNLLTQRNTEAMGELIEASSIPFLNSDRMLERGYDHPDRVSLPINNSATHATYYIACLASEKRRYNAVFNEIRSVLIRSSNYFAD